MSSNYYSNNYVSYDCCNYSNSNQKWSQIPYPGQTQVYKGVEPTAGYWPMNYFRYMRNYSIVDNKGKSIKFDIKNPNLINFYKELKKFNMFKTV